MTEAAVEGAIDPTIFRRSETHTEITLIILFEIRPTDLNGQEKKSFIVLQS